MKRIVFGFYLFTLSGSLLAQSAEQIIKLVASDRSAGNQFGTSVSINGNYAAVGASDISEGNIQNSCECVYVFEKNTTGSWVQVQKLVAPDGEARDGFGFSLSISGNFLLVGAPFHDKNEKGGDPLPDAGAAYVFERNSGGQWSLKFKTEGLNRQPYDFYGYSVSLSGFAFIVGAPGQDFDAWNSNFPLSGAGAAYCYEISGPYLTIWAKMTAPDRSEGAAYGRSVSISGDYAAVGAPFESKDASDPLGYTTVSNGNPMAGAGAVYIYKGRSVNVTNMFVHKIVDWDRAAGDQFGYSVAINGNTLMVGAPFEDEDNRSDKTTVLSAGSVHVFRKMSDERWWWTDKLVAADRAVGDNFGFSVSFSGNTAIIGAVSADEAVNSLNGSGAAYVFFYDGDKQGWLTKQMKIVASDRAANDWFGYAVAVDNNTIITSAPFQDRADTRVVADDAGAVYIFGKAPCIASTSSISPVACKTYTSPSNKHTWTRSGQYKDTIANSNGCDSIINIDLTVTTKIDTTVSVNGSTLTAHAEHASFQWINCTISERIEGANAASFTATQNGDYAVRIDQNGCYAVSPCFTIKLPPIDKKPLEEPITPESSSVLKAFTETNKLVAGDRTGNENFGYAVAISGGYAVVGANVDDEDPEGSNPLNDAGSAYVFKKGTNGKWTQIQKIVASDRQAGDNFGWSVAISFNHIVVGAPYHDKDLAGSDYGPSIGAAYVFELDGSGTWIQKQKIIAYPLESQVLFGSAVAIDGNTIAVGSPSYSKDETGKPETNLNSAGAVFVYNKSGNAWLQAQVVTPQSRTIANLGDEFGCSVSICGDLMIAGAWQAGVDPGSTERMNASGAAYIFERSGGKWKEVQRIVASDRAAYDEFGISVAISGDNAIIGARRKTETSDPNSGAYTGNAYIFSRGRTPGRTNPDGSVIVTPETNGQWREVLKINPADRKSNDYLGWSVGISGDYAIVSARSQDSDISGDVVADGGAIYVFYQDKRGNWTQSGKLTTADRSQFDNFGYAIAISGCDIIGGTIVDQEDANGGNALTSAGSAYVFSAADCRNVAPCYKFKLTPDEKTPIDKNRPPKEPANSSDTSSTPGIVDINAPRPKTDSVETKDDTYDFSTTRICFDIVKPNIHLPPRTLDPYYYNIPTINPDGSLKVYDSRKDELAAYTDKMWAVGQVIKVGFFNDAGGTTFIRDKIIKYAKEWEKYANVKFEFVDAVGKAEIKIGFADRGKSWSWFGRDILFNPLGLATMNFGWFTDQSTEKDFRVTTMHEFGHALGFIHEHQSPAAGINWDKEKVYAFFAQSPNNWTRADVDINIFNAYNKTSLNYSSYDPFSIMHYFFPAGLTTDGTAFPDVDYISSTDIQYARRLYPFGPNGKDATGVLRTLDDCDEIDFSVEYNVVDPTVIEFTLQPGIDHHNKTVTWWKRIGIPSKGGVEIELEIENGSVANKKIPVDLIDNELGITFWKAKFLGVHTLLPYKWWVLMALRGGCRVTLTWRRDTCL